jgi:hypothetical protein
LAEQTKNQTYLEKWEKTLFNFLRLEWQQSDKLGFNHYTYAELPKTLSDRDQSFKTYVGGMPYDRPN